MILATAQSQAAKPAKIRARLVNHAVAGCIIGLSVFGSTATAEPVTRDFNYSATLNGAGGSGSASGTFTYSYANGAVTSANLSSTAGTRITAGGGGPVTATNYTTVANIPGQPVNSSLRLTVVNGPLVQNTRGILVIFNPTLDQQTPQVSQTAEFICTNADCTTTEQYRAGSGAITDPVTAQPAPVPTMSEWALILFGSILAGAAALYVQRRRMA